MPDRFTHDQDANEHPDWNPALPPTIPEPTPWPAALSLASTLLVWGLISSMIITYVGLFLFAISLAYWIGDIRHERRTQSTHTTGPTTR